jgi:hypothetical protein
VNDFVTLFKISYEVTYQDNHREFLAKEYGQMKNFIKLYDVQTCIKIIVAYTTSAEDYSKSFPTIPSLVYLKDDIYKQVKSIKTSNKIIVDDEDDF